MRVNELKFKTAIAEFSEISTNFLTDYHFEYPEHVRIQLQTSEAINIKYSPITSIIPE